MSYTAIKERRLISLRKLFLIIACLALCGAVAGGAIAQTWPDRPLKFVVAAPAGSSIDVLARIIGDRLKDRLGQPIVVDNRPAAGGTPEDFANLIKGESDKWAPVIKKTGAKID
jgi:hypothetical protein